MVKRTVKAVGVRRTRGVCRVAGDSSARDEGPAVQHVQVFALVIVAVAVTAVCRRREWPAPLVLVGVALIFSLVPAVPRYEIQPEILLEFVLPPLLYSAALSSSYRDFRTSLNSIT